MSGMMEERKTQNKDKITLSNENRFHLLKAHNCLQKCPINLQEISPRELFQITQH